MELPTISIERGAPKRLIGAVALASVLGFGFAGQALANTAANALIRNTVSVSAANAATASAVVDVTVNLVAANPTLTQVTANSSTTAGGSVTYTYNLQTNSNGSQTFAISSALVSETNAGSSAATVGTPSVTSVTLGATTVTTGVAIASGGSGTITVPSDEVSDSSANGIATGDLVVINGHTYSVGTITEGGSSGASGSVKTTTIALTNTDSTAYTVAVGDIVQEYTTFTVQVSAASGGYTATDVITSSATANDATNTKSATVNTTQTTVSAATLTVKKYVRNVTTGAAGTGTSITVNTKIYYPTGVSANPGEYLEYAVEVSNSSGTDATVVTATDNVPAYTTLVNFASATGYVDPTVTAPDGTGSATDVFAKVLDGTNTGTINIGTTTADAQSPGTAGFGDATGTTAGATLNFELGSGSNDTTGGTVANGSTYHILYMVKVD